MISEPLIIGTLIAFIGVVATTNGVSIVLLFRQGRHWYALFAAVLFGLSCTWIDWLVMMFMMSRFG